MNARWLSCLLTLFLIGCSFNQPYKPPKSLLPENWVGRNQGLLPSDHCSLSSTQAPWWRNLNDTYLEKIIMLALQQNYDLQIAASKIHQARADRKIAESGLLPGITASFNPWRGNQGTQTNNKVTDVIDAKFDAQWELDIFGALQDQVNAEDAQVSAQEFAHEAAKISIVAEIIRNYIDLRLAQNQYSISQKILETLLDLRELALVLYQAGILSEMDTAQAQALVENQQADLPHYKLQITSAIRRLEGLCSLLPGALDKELETFRPLPLPSTNLLLQTPADVIAARPDVRQAERHLAIAAALEMEAHKLIFPKITLAGLFGLQDTSRAGRTNIWSVDGALSLPFLNFGAIEGQIEKAENVQHEAFLTYQKHILQALQEVEIGLESYFNETERLDHLQHGCVNAEKAATYALERFKGGIAALQTVLTSHKTLYESQLITAYSRAAQLTAWVSLQKALGASVH